MKLKIFIIGIILMMVGSTFAVSSEVKDDEDIQNTVVDNVVEIRVARHSAESRW